MSILVIDVGTSGVRASSVRDDGSIEEMLHRRVPPSTPSPGVVEFDPLKLAQAVEELAGQILASRGPVEAVGIATQRASTILWERATGVPVAPGIGWQDLRTAGQCLMLRQRGVRLAPNQSATKLAYLLDLHDPDRTRDLCFGTVDTWVAHVLSGGALHVTDASNAAVTGLLRLDASGYDDGVLDALRVPESVLPEIVDSTGVLATASLLAGAPPIAGLVGDQQGSLLGQGCLAPGEAKATFGTGGMLDCTTGTTRPEFAVRGESGTFPIVTWRAAGRVHWGIEAIMLSAGSAVDWVRDGLGLIQSAEDSDRVAASVPDAGGVVFVPALSGLGTPLWDFGARGALTGIAPSTTGPEIVRAVLEGVAHRGADLVDAAEADAGVRIDRLRVDGGMSQNATFVQCLADAIGRDVVLARITEATTLGAAFLAGCAVGTWSGLGEACALARPRAIIGPKRRLDRGRWFEARARALRNVAALSALEF